MRWHWLDYTEDEGGHEQYARASVGDSVHSQDDKSGNGCVQTDDSGLDDNCHSDFVAWPEVGSNDN